MVKKVYVGLAEKKAKEKRDMMQKVKDKAAEKLLKQQKDAEKKGVKLPPISSSRRGTGEARRAFGGKQKPKWVDLLDKEHANAIISDSF